MHQFPPPPQQPPLEATDDPLHQIHFRLWQIVATFVTVLATAWLWTMSPYLGVTAAFLAKHIIVAILMSGLKVHR